MSLIRTIQDDDPVPVVEEEEEVVDTLAKKSKKKELNALDIDFDSISTSTQHPWDFTYAKKIARKTKEGITTVDNKIQMKLAKKSKEWKQAAREFQDYHRNAMNDENEEKPRKQAKKDDSEGEEEEEEELIGEDEEDEEDNEEEADGIGEDNGENGDGEDKENSDAEEQEEEEDEKDEEMEILLREDRIRKIPITGNKKKKAFFTKPDNPDYLASSFTDLHLSRPLLKALSTLGYSVPSPIQSQTIPIAMQGKDICASASTGSGKTAAFVLPVLERLLHRDKRVPTIRVLILTPTRELAVQCHSVIEKLAKFTDVRTCLVMGGISNEQQEAALRRLPDIIVATPGRMIDHLHNAQSFALDNIDILILDEADRLLDMGFTAELEEIVKFCPKGRQTMLFSATMTEEVDRLVSLSLNSPVRVAVDRQGQVASGISQEFIRVKPSKEDCRDAMLLALCTRTFKSQVIIFFRSKASCHRMKIIFGLAGLKAAELHGNLPQSQRLEALEDFRDGKFDYLLATDLAARGLDIIGIQVIINYVMPANLEQYIHRVGRTARFGNKGKSVSFVGERDRKLLKEIVKNSRDKVKSRIIPTEVIDQFKEKIDDMEHDIDEIFELESAERENRLAEREVNRAKNLIQHHDKIHSRPKRTWFQTQQEKSSIAEASGNEYFGEERESKKGDKGKKKHEMKVSRGGKEKRDEYSGLSRKQKRNKMARKQLEEESLPTQQGSRAADKSAKKEFRAKRQGFLPLKDRKPKSDQPARGPKKPAGGGTFDSDLKKPALGKRKRADMDDGPRPERKKPNPKKGKGQFKSKKKFKRR